MRRRTVRSLAAAILLAACTLRAGAVDGSPQGFATAVPSRVQAREGPAPQKPPAECDWPAGEGRLVGSGALRYFGFSVYAAYLWARERFEPSAYERSAFALELRYERHLDGEAIARRSLAEMRRIEEFSEEESRRWFEAMRAAFPDVAEGDRLTGTFDGAQRVCFFHNGRRTACLQDARFARLFFGIWLSDRTREPALRAQLLGSRP